MNTVDRIRATASIISFLAVVLALLRYFLQDLPEYMGPANETSFDPTLAPVKCIPIPVLDRLICTLVQNIVDSSKTDYGQSVLRDLKAFIGPLVFLLMVEASRLGNSWSLLLACMPFTAFVAFFYGGGTYLLMFVPLMNYARKRIQKTSSASHIPLARIYAILVANAIHMGSIIYMLTLGPTQEGEAHSQALQRIMFSLWFIYTPLTWLFEVLMEFVQVKEIKARELVFVSALFMAAVNVVLQVWAVCRGGSTPQHLHNFFYRPFPLRDKEYAPAFSLMWLLFATIGASWSYVLSDAYHLIYIDLLTLFSATLSPGGALMLFAVYQEIMRMNYAQYVQSVKRAQ
jgi:hypothetical protein